MVRRPTVAGRGEINQRFWDRAAEERQLPTCRHRFYGVQDDIGKATVELLGISQRRRYKGSPIHLELNALLLQTLAVNLDHTLEESRQNYWSTVQSRRPGQFEEFFNDKIDPVQLLGHNAVKFFHKATVVMFATDELGKSAHGSQGILNLVCHARRHLSQGGKAVSTVQAVLQGLEER